MEVRARRLEYAIRMTDTTFFRLQRIVRQRCFRAWFPLAVSLTRKVSLFLQKFFACTVWAFATRTVKNVNHVEWNSLHFSFPA